jgi:hypothetical protein
MSTYTLYERYPLRTTRAKILKGEITDSDLDQKKYHSTTLFQALEHTLNTSPYMF